MKYYHVLVGKQAYFSEHIEFFYDTIESIRRDKLNKYRRNKIFHLICIFIYS